MRTDTDKANLAGWYIKHEDGTVDAHGVSVVEIDGVEHWALDYTVVYPQSASQGVHHAERRAKSLHCGKYTTGPNVDTNTET